MPVEKLKRPSRKAYGFITSNTFEEGSDHWVIEGGEEKYYLALEKWQDQQEQLKL